ncbi:fork head domain-containing protein [Colletotrichum incanum]|nr:fork head domain-containing protein [Colletotrichum incanum]
MNQTAWVFPKSTSAEGFDNNRKNSSNYYSEKDQDVPTSQIYISPGNLQTFNPYDQLHYDNGVFHQVFGPCRVEKEGLQQSTEEGRLQNAYQPMNASVSRYSSSPASFLGGFMVEPNVVPELGQQTLPSTSALLQEQVDSEKPYAKLIHKALKEADKHTMTLQELYSWFQSRTDKPKKRTGTGWQSSIRHNLSMNPAFRMVEQTSLPRLEGRKTGPKKGMSKWTLDHAYIDAIRPTTQFRPKRPNPGRKSSPKALSHPQGTGGRNKTPYVSSVTPNLNPVYPSCAMQGHVISGTPGDCAMPKKKTRAANRRLGGHHQQNISPKEAEFIKRHGDPDSVSAMAFAGSLNGSGGSNTRLPVAFTNTGAGVPTQHYQVRQVGIDGINTLRSSSPADGLIYGWTSYPQL